MAAKLYVIAFYVLLVSSDLSKAISHPRLMSRHSRDASALRDTLETAEVPRPSPVYYGCFLGKNLQLLNNTILDGNTNALCQKYCYDMKHMFSATHDDICGCLKDHPQKELSGPQHDGATVTTTDSVHDCTAPCPGHNTDKCDKQFCCGGPGAYTVYQTGGMKSHSLAAIKVLKNYNLNIVKSHLIPMLNEISRRTQIPVKELEEEVKKPTDAKDYKALLRELTQSKIPQGANTNKTLKKKSTAENDGLNDGFHACCSPDCDWLLDYLELDKTVVVCCYGEGEDQWCEKTDKR
ncbi:uncharacterized protein LOC110250568 isoform X2 [Exaiptasia diaphana]|uniref:WSC domain-containing protein n=1 Tax=Exaiptasia diaphana TaxID=2652724 RepID=A0A913YSF5_EXADI|nr:uncharacterized protein LOC110250568 isoform X2 [Exaiptasia diaphana]